MKVFDLQCPAGHRFEGWFGSEDAFVAQQGDATLTCPVCRSADVVRVPNAARLNRSRAPASTPSDRLTVADPGSGGDAARPSSDRLAELQGRWLTAMRQEVDRMEDVGSRFSEEARRIHHGEAPERGIRGQASADEARALREEGIDVLPLPPAAVPKSQLH